MEDVILFFRFFSRGGVVVVVWNVQISLYPSIHPMMDDRHGDKTCIHTYQTAYYMRSILHLYYSIYFVLYLKTIYSVLRFVG
jgi:hypothetical protein